MSSLPEPARLSRALRQLSVFMNLYEDDVFMAFLDLLDAAAAVSRGDGHSEQERDEKAARFAGLLYQHDTDCWSDYLEELVLCSDTCLSRSARFSPDYASAMFSTGMNELNALSQATSVTCSAIGMPRSVRWRAVNKNMQGRYLARLMELDRYGTGIYPKAGMFRLANDETVRLIPVRNGDPVTFDQLYGYEEQHQHLIDNTKALLLGLPCSNLLLYGDAGTGKSASIKAVLNLFAQEGLRLVEVGRDQLALLPDLLDELADEPLKFIVYIDDLSFGENDDTFSALKAVLEGSVCARSQNVVIYATSNRRHLVKESMSARTGDDMHRRDTLQETLSLSQRFGECLFFEKPNHDRFNALVDSIADEYGLKVNDRASLHTDAAAFALSQGGQSARAARQYIERLAAKEGLLNHAHA